MIKLSDLPVIKYSMFFNSTWDRERERERERERGRERERERERENMREREAKEQLDMIQRLEN